MKITSSNLSGTQNSSDAKSTAVVLNTDSVKLIGRTYLIDNILWTAFSGTGAEFRFTGKKLELSFIGDYASTADKSDNYVHFAVYVDGKRVIDALLKEKEKTYTVFESDTEKCIDVQIIKLSECAMSTFGIKPINLSDGEKIEPVEAKDIKIEFIGDSITCGYGVDDPDKEHHFKTSTEDVTKAYSYKTAKALNADYSMVSVSGYGIISGYTDNDVRKPEQTIPQYYEKLGFSYNKFADTLEVAGLDWNFDNYRPNIVVLNLGTNDMSYAKTDELKAEFEQEYVKFLKLIRSHNPNAFIFCTYGVMGGDLIDNITRACTDYTDETGDTRIRFIPLDMQNEEKNGIVADYHPSPATHTLCAEKLTNAIRAELNIRQ